jgi:hypothetical protein
LNDPLTLKRKVLSIIDSIYLAKNSARLFI